MIATSDKIRFGHALSGAGVPSSAPAHDYSHLVRARLTLSGSGENAAFEACLPRSATVTRQIALDDWGSDWLVLELDDPFEFDGSPVSYCVVRARWLDHPIGSEFCPVFVLTDPQHHLTANECWNSRDFEFVSWAEVAMESPEAPNASNHAIQRTAPRSDA